MSATEYWLAVRDVEKRLRDEHGDCVFLTGNETSRTTEAEVEYAARAIVEGSHHVATPEEIEAYRESMALALVAGRARQEAPPLMDGRNTGGPRRFVVEARKP